MALGRIRQGSAESPPHSAQAAEADRRGRKLTVPQATTSAEGASSTDYASPTQTAGWPGDLDLLLRVLELRQGLDGFLGRAGEYVLPVLLLQLVDRNRDIVSAETDEPPCPDDDVGHRSLRRDDDVVDPPDPHVLFVVDRLAQDLPLGAPPYGDGLELFNGHAKGG